MTGGGWGDMHTPNDQANTLNYSGHAEGRPDRRRFGGSDCRGGKAARNLPKKASAHAVSFRTASLGLVVELV